MTLNRCFSSASNIINRDKLHFCLVRLRSRCVIRIQTSSSPTLHIVVKCNSAHTNSTKMSKWVRTKEDSTENPNRRKWRILCVYSLTTIVRQIFDIFSPSLFRFVVFFLSISIFFSFSSLLDFRLFSLFFYGDRQRVVFVLCISMLDSVLSFCRSFFTLVYSWGKFFFFLSPSAQCVLAKPNVGVWQQQRQQ